MSLVVRHLLVRIVVDLKILCEGERESNTSES